MHDCLPGAGIGLARPPRDQVGGRPWVVVWVVMWVVMWVVVSARKARYLKPVRTQSPRVPRALLRRPKLQRWQ